MDKLRLITDRKSAAQTLHESEERLQNITDAIPGVVYRFLQYEDGRQIFEFISRGMLELLDLGPSDKQVSFEEFLGYVIPDDEAALMKSIAVATSGRSSWSHQFRVRTATGKVKWIRGGATPEPARNDGIIAFNGLLLDITQQIETEALLESTSRIAKIGGWELDVASGDVSVTEQIAAIYELPPDADFRMEPSFSFFESRAAQKLRDAIARATDTGEPWALELPLTTAKGNHLWVRSVGHAERVGGKTVRLAGTFQDITEVKEAEDALSRATRLNEQILEAAGEGIYGVDMEGRITFVNEAAAKMTGWQRSELIGQRQHEVLDHSAADGTPYAPENCRTCIALSDGKVHRVSDELFRRKDNTRFPVDYVSTPLHENEALLGAVVVFKDVTEAREMTATLSYQATHDSLTGLINRREFERRLDRVINTAKGQRTKNFVAYLDLDQFKIVNDTCGHVAGDELLRRLPPLLTQHLRESDTLARLGGDEFGILIEHCSLAQGHEIMRRVLDTISNFSFVWETHRFQIGVSIGLVEVGATATNLTDVLKRADAACYMAKESGRNRIHIYDEKDIDLTIRHGEMQWVSKIERALNEDRFTLYAQIIKPIRERKGDKINYEILVRIVDPDGAIIAPDQFLPAAERYGLAGRIDRWVIDKTLNWIAQRPAHQAVLETCAINLSGHSIADSSLLDFVRQRFAALAVSPEKIRFEITETAVIANIEYATKFIDTLRDLGCQFALDDFGSGLSSFAYLKTLNVDVIKIDGAFVKELASDVISETIVRSINDIAHALGRSTVAEFVEDDAILERLREIGVDYAQGYGIARPQPLDEIAP